MEDILSKLARQKDSMTRSQQTIAGLILQDPMFAAFSTVEQLANKTRVSTATVIRFANALGFSKGYSEFQLELQNFLKLRVDPIGRLDSRELIPSESASLVRQIYDLQLSNMMNTINRNSEHLFEKAAQAIMRAKHIYTIGGRGSYSIAYYLGHHLNRIYGNVDILPDTSRVADYIKRICPGDVWIVCNLPRYSKLMLSATSLAHQQGATIISIVDSLASPYAKISKYTFHAPHHSTDFHNSMVAPMFIAETLLALIFTYDKNAVRSSLGNIEPIFTALETFSQDVS